MEQVKVGVIGVGRMGANHCRIYSSLRKVDFVGVFDANVEVGKRIADRYEVQAFHSLDELLAEVNAVSIATPTQPHFDIVMECLNRGIHVLVEKPMTETLEQAQLLVNASDNSSSIVLVGHIERFNPVYTEFRNVVDDSSILAIEFRRLSPFAGSNVDVDVVLDLMTHDIDLVLDMMPQEPVKMNVVGLKAFSNTLDHVNVQLNYCDGPIVSITASRITEEKIRCINVMTRGAFIEADLLKKNISIHRRAVGRYLNQNLLNVKYHQESLVERILVPNIEPLMSEIQHFIECIHTGTPPRVSAFDGMRALEFACKIRHLAQANQVNMDEPEFVPA